MKYLREVRWAKSLLIFNPFLVMFGRGGGIFPQNFGFTGSERVRLEKFPICPKNMVETVVTKMLSPFVFFYLVWSYIFKGKKV